MIIFTALPIDEVILLMLLILINELFDKCDAFKMKCFVYYAVIFSVDAIFCAGEWIIGVVEKP